MSPLNFQLDQRFVLQYPNGYMKNFSYSCFHIFRRDIDGNVWLVAIVREEAVRDLILKNSKEPMVVIYRNSRNSLFWDNDKNRMNKIIGSISTDEIDRRFSASHRQPQTAQNDSFLIESI